ncbi:MAG: tripartite tricarboxylate transporter TctB family protein [Deltaproteobacteria bacterium]|nr:tripartite tricarboxylate transporter TctB family protein [Deltaproteobacteria bacterium]
MKADRASSMVWMAVGLLSIYGSFQLGLGTLGEPGSGFLSFLAGSFICLMALIVFLQSFLQGKGFQVKISTLWKGIRWYRSALVGLLLLVYILVLEWIGFLLTAFLIVLAMIKGVEKLSWGKALLISISASAVCYLVFDKLLKAALPRGLLGF